VVVVNKCEGFVFNIKYIIVSRDVIRASKVGVIAPYIVSLR